MRRNSRVSPLNASYTRKAKKAATPAFVPPSSLVLYGFATDPTVIFTALVLLLPILLSPSPAAGLSYFFHPLLLLSYALLAALLWLARSRPCAPLSPSELRLARWCLCNGLYFNLFLDVFAGQFQALGEMTVQYNRVEPRYALGPLSDAGAAVFMTSMLELCAQAPLGICAFLLLHRGSPWRHTAVLLLSALHLCGVWYFYIPEILNGFAHLGGWPQSVAEALSLHRIIFFWFGFWFCGMGVWVIVPSLYGYSAAREIAAAVAVSSSAAREEKEAD